VGRHPARLHTLHSRRVPQLPRRRLRQQLGRRSLTGNSSISMPGRFTFWRTLYYVRSSVPSTSSPLAWALSSQGCCSARTNWVQRFRGSWKPSKPP